MSSFGSQGGRGMGGTIGGGGGGGINPLERPMTAGT